MTPEYVNKLFDRYGISEGPQDRYVCGSSFEFAMLLHRKLMNPENMKHEAFVAERGLLKLNVFSTLIYRDVVFHDDLGLCFNGERKASTLQLLKDYDSWVLEMNRHFGTLDETVVSGVEASELLAKLMILVECEREFFSHREATAKALAKASDNIASGQHLCISNVGGKLEVNLKG